ncbi:MAG: 1-deoxy-D-xylulose-5-phosphate synthase [Acidimicrobiales bacterium]
MTLSLMLLPSIKTPADLRSLDYEQLDQLAEEIRSFIVEAVTRTGGHLGSNLGAVELTLALHRVFESPRDPILWDTGHQAYVHKLLTGRQGGFAELRKKGGLSGYPSRAESEHDWIENSHASTALSYAHGLATALQLDHELIGSDGNRRVVAVVGDGALTGGMAYEALNNLGHSGRRVVIILNDNGRSYAPTVSHLSQSLTALRLNPTYMQTRQRFGRRIRNLPAVGELAASGMIGLTSALREIVAPRFFFEALGVRYAGPIDGHDIAVMEQAFSHASEWDGPIVVHVLTHKGRGYAPAEEDEVQRLHDVKSTRPNPTTHAEPQGSRTSSNETVEVRTYTDAFTRALIAEAEANPAVVALTAAMPGPTGLLAFEQRFAERCFDVGIAEQHEVTSAAGLAMGGRRPVVAVYSTFLSRAFDQMNLDVGLHHLPVVFVLDRAGITGENGPSHHGIWDMALALSIPGMAVFAPSSSAEVGVMLHEALKLEGPALIRFPTTPPPPGSESGEGMKARLVRHGDGEVCLLTVGKMLAACQAAADTLRETGIEATVWDVRVVSPPDPEMLEDAVSHRLVMSIEDGVRFGGAGMFIADALTALARGRGVEAPTTTALGIPREYLAQGRPDDILADLGLDGPGITASVLSLLDRGTKGSEQPVARNEPVS